MLLVLNTPATMSYQAPTRSVLHRKQSIEEMIDNRVLIAIARCESGLRQFNKDGSVLRGVVNNKDTGLFQISKTWHGKRAKKLEIDIETLQGNIKFAKLLYEEQGVRPWRASAGCHKYYSNKN